MMRNIAIWPYKEILFSPYCALLHHVRHPKTYPLDFVHVYSLERWSMCTQSRSYLMIEGDLLSDSCSPYSACHRVIDNALKAPTESPKPYKQFWAKIHTNIW